MANIATMLKTEITRLCRRELRREVAAMKKASASYRRDIAALKRKIVALERNTNLLSKRAAPLSEKGSATLPDRPVRFVAKGLRALRTRLDLSAAQLALVLGVSEQSVYNWETKKATPRKEQLAAIIGMRSIGKREAQQRLESVKTSSGSARKKTTKKRK
jgi:DNA-binding transcriptional regulator YiaG